MESSDQNEPMPFRMPGMAVDTPQETSGPAPAARDDSSLTSLSDLEEAETGAEVPREAEVQGTVSADRDGAQEAGVRQDQGPTQHLQARKPSQMRLVAEENRFPYSTLPPTPNLDLLLARRERELEVAVKQATNNYSLQEQSFELVQATIESLPTGEQQSMISLMLNRYTSFCTSVDIPLFPLSPVKVTLFLSQALSVNFRANSIRPNKLPLPTIDPKDTTLSSDEGTRLTQELAEAWLSALAYAQLSTIELWGKAAPQSPALAPLSDDPILRELVSTIPSIRAWQDWEEAEEAKMKAKDAAKTKTRWTKHGKAVSGPSRSSGPPADSKHLPPPPAPYVPLELPPPPQTVEGSEREDNAYAFEMPAPPPPPVSSQ